ncbi:hypothetical protein Cyast_0876 [Cyanobacterium stanieri PCC 7202]|uniref:DUF2993 domain-containing protein n=1 Tax=Cyanobacterium stanieri (strain ATCC 29140 / PCC 7202) TaxID=292563 RepID=K9YL67_CYASC|nr:hypothetical protein Cyast_0876 [Cyanobacterium stanieri PCC 7202]
MNSKKKSEIIARFLTPAIKFWIRNQVESITQLEVEIDAGDKQILSGKINQVYLSANEANYQGIFINQASVSTEDIAVNLGGILRGKPLKLLHPIFVSGDIVITAQELQKSLESSLLIQGLQDVVKLILENQRLENILEKYHIQWKNINIENQQVTIQGNINNNLKKVNNTLNITSNINIQEKQKLLLTDIKIEGIPELNNLTINDLIIDLGNEVAISELTISPHKIHCTGKIKVVS